MEKSAFGVIHKALSFKKPSNVDKPFKRTLRSMTEGKNKRAGRQVYRQNQENAQTYARQRNPFGGENPF